MGGGPLGTMLLPVASGTPPDIRCVAGRWLGNLATQVASGVYTPMLSTQAAGDRWLEKLPTQVASSASSTLTAQVAGS